MTRREEPVPLRDALTEVGNELGLPPTDALTAILAAWPEVVGPTLAAHAKVRTVRAGECVIEVDGPAWATQLRYVGDDLTTRLNERCGSPVVTAIRVTISRP